MSGECDKCGEHILDCECDKFESLENLLSRTYHVNIPDVMPSFEEKAKLMRINADMIMKEISDHVDKEIEKLKNEHAREIKRLKDKLKRINDG